MYTVLLVFTIPTIFVIYGIYFEKKARSDWSPTTGIVCEIVRVRIADSSALTPKVQYLFEGKEYKEIGAGNKSGQFYSVGDRVEILVNPTKPNQFALF